MKVPIKMMIMKNTIRYCSLLALTCLLFACGRMEQPVADTDGEHSFTLRLVGGVVPFDGGTKSTGEFVPTADNRLYVRLVGALGPVLGTARYDEGSASWKFTYNGSLGGATSGAAHAVLFERMIESENDFRVVMRYVTPIYEDTAGSFSVNGNEFTLNATLTPKTGRISFIHDLQEGEGRWIERIGGISYYKYFDLSDFSFQAVELDSEEDSRYFVKANDNGNNGEYLYGFFTDPEDPQIMLRNWSNDDTYYFYRHMSPNVFQPGQSGFVDWPEVNPTGWRKFHYGMAFNIGRWFHFTFVPAGTFRMGLDADPTASPAHDVTLNYFYMSEQEVTRNMWYAVMGEPSYWAGVSTPVTDRSYEEIQAFTTALSAYSTETSQYRFRLPTEAEWEYAARGAIYSHGYMYSGSNTVNDVAIRYWEYSGGQKNANELGLTDMSGGVAELCSDWFGSYTKEAQINPTGPATGDYHVVRGGYWGDPDESLTVWHRASTKDFDANSGSVGFRLVMEVPVLDK